MEGDIEEEKVAAASTNASNGPVTSAEELADVGRWHIISVPQARWGSNGPPTKRFHMESNAGSPTRWPHRPANFTTPPPEPTPNKLTSATTYPDSKRAAQRRQV